MQMWRLYVKGNDFLFFLLDLKKSQLCAVRRATFVPNDRIEAFKTNQVGGDCSNVPFVMAKCPICLASKVETRVFVI